VAGVTNANGGIAVDTDKFTVSAAGAVVVALTLNVTGAVTLGSTLAVEGNVSGTGGVGNDELHLLKCFPSSTATKAIGSEAIATFVGVDAAALCIELNAVRDDLIAMGFFVAP
jgi:hypothetical protein